MHSKDHRYNHAFIEHTTDNKRKQPYSITLNTLLLPKYLTIKNRIDTNDLGVATYTYT